MIDHHKSLVENEVRRRFDQKKVHLAVSLTDQCPLRCSHCIVSALHGNKVDKQAAEKLSLRILSEISHSANRIGMISFTGGESPLASSAFKILGEGAAKAGVKCALISSGYWATSEQRAKLFLDSHKFIERLTISIDKFHTEYLNINTALNAVRAGVASGVATSIRLSRYRTDPESDQLISDLSMMSDVEVEVQHIVGGGRASEDAPGDFIPDDDQVLSQCFTSGPHIDHVGNMLPCCSNIIHLSNSHQLRLGSIFDQEVGMMLSPYFKNKILKTIRVLGWDYIANDVGLTEASGIQLASHGGCRQCQAIMGEDEAVSRIDKWSAFGGCDKGARYAEDWIASSA